MKNPDIKKKALISGIAGTLLLVGGVILAICVTPNGYEKFLYDATGMILDINGDGVSGKTSAYVPQHPDGYALPSIDSYESPSIDGYELSPPEDYEDF